MIKYLQETEMAKEMAKEMVKYILYLQLLVITFL